MIGNKKILALIPARGGSKGIPHKNIKPIGGKPLLAYTIETALNSRYIDKVVVSTDSEEIREKAIDYGAEVPFLRPEALAEDTSTTLDVVLHAINEIEKHESFDILILLQPTSPLRTVMDIDMALEKFVAGNFRPLTSVSMAEDHPRLIRKLIDEWTMQRITPDSSSVRRQDMDCYYRVNGSIYVNLITEIDINTSFNDNEIPFVMESSHSVDIDEEKDIAMVEYYLKQKEARA